MQTWLYDGSFEGFLSTVFDLYLQKQTDIRVRKEMVYLAAFFEKAVFMPTVEVNANRVWVGLGTRLSPKMQRYFYCNYLAEISGEEDNMIAFIRYVFSTPQRVEEDFSNPHVLRVHQLARKVLREKHHMEAFVRFKHTPDGMFYATIEPEFNVLPLIMPHFKDRYADQRWIIYDNNRKYGIYFDLEKVSTVSLDFGTKAHEKAVQQDSWTPEEDLYQQLWKTYFKEANIPARENRKLQLQHMPRRYWKYITEVKGEP